MPCQAGNTSPGRGRELAGQAYQHPEQPEAAGPQAAEALASGGAGLGLQLAHGGRLASHAQVAGRGGVEGGQGGVGGRVGNGGEVERLVGAAPIEHSPDFEKDKPAPGRLANP